MHVGFFPSLFDKPARIRFIEQEEGERIELFLRRHFITNIPWIITSIVVFFLPIILAQLDQLLATNLISQLPPQLIIGSLIIFYLLVIAYVVENFLFWYFNIYIVTNIHLVDISLVSILSRSVVEIELNDIQTVSSQISGVIRSFFNFGNVVIKTAAKGEDVVFEEVPRPDFVADRVQDLREIFIQRSP